MEQSDTDMTNDEAYELGKAADSILQNPFWLDWPSNPVSEEATLARFFVSGWCEKEQSNE
jgi:hypothetical protein